ncbi:DEAD/DEAH box helicase [Desulfovibrio sp. OttesenSCG-928-A18]|nr:DEAD/DEAH box helicase [Desulfovibrio sp. OttesenSCG-928-A18]
MKKYGHETVSVHKDRGRRPIEACHAKAADSGLVGEYIAALLASDKLGPQVTSHTILEGKSPEHAQTARPWPRAMEGILEGMGIGALYSHQARAMDALRAGRHVVVATPTASGKSLIYTLPVLERFLKDPDARSLYLFPLKALARDQLASFQAMTAHWPEEARPGAAVYDGDTTAHFRRKIRDNPPQVLISNPEMLHLSLLPHHRLWTTFFAGLSLVVVDEVHSYRGILGSHMALVFRRLLRIAALYGSSPVFAFCSATIGNPAELAGLLTGAEPEAVLESGAPQGRRHYVFMNPLESPAALAIKLLKAALARKLRSIVYCQSRRMTELISLWASEQSGPYATRISAYRAGFLPEERRGIEAAMASGELLAVISTSALELGIDIGELDLCILVGYPGTVMATLQRGGRVGRSSQESLVLLVAQEDALDQYIVRHAEDFFRREPEKAALNPENPVIAARHLECAAAELPLRPGRLPDQAWLSPPLLRVAKTLEQQGLLLRSADGGELMAARKRPQRHVSLRGSGNTVSIESADGTLIGSVDGIRALREAHPGSIYLHLGRHFEISELDLAAGRALARPFRPSWYTRTRSHKDTEILSLDGQKRVAGMAVQRGRLRITDTVTGYEKRALKNGQLMGVVPLDLPSMIFETEGFWFQIPPGARQRIEDARMHFMGAIHALEHAEIGILPLLVMADRNDFGGISTPMHAQTGMPTVFVYDGMPGGAGLSTAAFDRAGQLFAHVLRVMADCPCELGCPSCVHSPKCGSGNRPIDKEGAMELLRLMLEDSEQNREEAEALLARAPSGLEAAAGGEAPHGQRERGLLRMRTELQTQAADSAALARSGRDAANGNGAAPGAVAAGGGAPGRGIELVGGALDAALPGCGAADACLPGGSGSPGLLPGSGATGGSATDGNATGGNATGCGDTGGGDGPGDFVVLDVETRYSASEVGGWHKAGRMGVSVAVLYDSRSDSFHAYTQEEIPAMAELLAGAPLVVGFNILRFDYTVLEPHAPGFTFRRLPTLDMLARVHEQLSYRVSLDNLACATLGSAKNANGLLALKWWKEGRLTEIEEYCRQDVALTRDLYLFGKAHGYLLFTNKAGQKVRVRVAW